MMMMMMMNDDDKYIYKLLAAAVFPVFHFINNLMLLHFQEL